MSVPSARPPRLALVLSCLSSCLLVACGSDAPPAPDPPVLTHVYWIAGGAPQLVWSRLPDPGLQPAVLPLATEIDFVFHRRLDGEKIEDTVTDGGVTTTRPKEMPPIRVTWPDMATAPGDPPVSLSVAYNSTARFGGQSSYVFARPNPAGFPSSATITFELDLANLTNAQGEPALPPVRPIVVNTSAFTVAVAASPAAVTTSYQVPLVFSNRLSSVAAAIPFVQVTAGGAALASKLLADTSDPSRVYLAPADCLGKWPAQTTFTVTIDEKLTDAFGRALAKGVTAMFRTGAPTAFTPDASCPVADGGGDAPEGDAASDGGDDAPDSAAPEAGETPDGGVDAAADTAD